MQIVHELGGIPLRAAYSLIKAISKKKQKAIDAERPRFIEGAASKGLGNREAEELFDLILKFAGYGFNKSHSTAYAIVAYQTAYLKTYFPNQYMAAFLTFESAAQKTSDWIPYLDDCRRTVKPDGAIGVDVKPPDVNLSQADFSVVFDEGEAREAARGHVRFGLRAIKGVGAKAIDAIVAEREASGAYTSLYDFCERVPPGVVNRATIEALIKCGALDSVHGRVERAGMCATIEPALSAGQTLARDKAAGQTSLFGFGGGGGEAPAAAAVEKAPAPPLVRVKAWDEGLTLSNEKEVLGFYVSSHPLDRWRSRLEMFANVTTTSLRQAPQDRRIVIGGLIQSIRPIVTRNGKSAGQKMAIVTLEDRLGAIEAVLFAEMFGKHGGDLAPDAIVFLMGKVDHSRGDPQIIVDRVVPVEKAQAELAGCVELTLDERRLNGESSSTLEYLRGIIGQHTREMNGAATAELRLVVLAGGRRVTLRAARTRVSPTDQFLVALEQTLGAGNVRVLAGEVGPGPRRVANGRRE